MSVRFISYLLLLAILATVGLASKNPNETNDESVHALSYANQKFSLDLYMLMARPRENLIFSGFGVSTVLSMLLQGSQGYTRGSILTSLGYENITTASLDKTYKKLLTDLRGKDDYELSVANSLWVSEKFNISETYQDKLRECYNSEAKELKIKTALEDINLYVAEKTHDLIPKFLEQPVRPDTIMILLNALFFKGTWETQFDNQTFPAGFIDNDDEIAQDAWTAVTTMMRVKDEFPFVDCDELKAEVIELPYKGGEVSMIITLPSQGTTLVEMEETLTLDKLLRSISKLEPTNISLIMPKFSIKSSLDLEDELVNLGFDEIFSSQANFSGISEHSDLWVTEVKQKAVIEVTPEGSKAAAVTALHMNRIMPIIPIKPFRQMRIIHPFLFVILHKPTDTFLFMGRFTQSTPLQRT